MFKNYLKTAIRFLKRNKIFAGINILGLSIALSASFIILLYVINELSYDHNHRNRKLVYRVVNYYTEFKTTQAGTPYILATAMKEEFPQVKKAIRSRPMRDFKIKLKDEYINVFETIATDSEVFDIFTLPLVSGSNTGKLLDDRNSIVLSLELAEKLFPGTEATGKEIQVRVNNEEQLFTVTGVMENIPPNSTFRAKCLVNSSWTLDPINKAFRVQNAEKSWHHDFWNTWVLLKDNKSAAEIDGMFESFGKKNISENPNKRYSLQCLTDVYLKSDQINNSGIRGNMSNIRLFSAIAVLIILVAAINYIILSTAVSTGRAKEIGIRKTNGAANGSINIQMLTESVLLSLIVLPFALVLMQIGLPYAGKLFQTKLLIIGSNLFLYLTVYFFLTVLIGVASGLYSAVWLSRLGVTDVLKNAARSGKRKSIIRSALIVIQLIIFCGFVSGMLIIRSQYNYALKRDPGFTNSNIVLVNLGRGFSGYASFIHNIRSNPNIILAAGTMEGLPMVSSMSSVYSHFQDKEQKIKVEGMAVDFNFLKTMGIQVIQGRDFSEEFGSDLANSGLLNETAVKQLGIKDPVGQKLGGKNIIGIVKDFNLHSIHTEIPPLLITMTDRYINQVAVSYKPESLKSILPFLESEWKKAAPERPFSYTTIEDLMKEIYSEEKNLSIIVSIFALFTLLIAAFGLFGLTLFVARSRTKEIGIRKVVGCPEQTIIYSFLRANLIQVLVATLLSVPLTLYIMTEWLSRFSSKTPVQWWFFLVSFVSAAVVVVITVLFQSYKAARINPVEALRYE